ncbi:MAG: hypothetical protein A2082_06850 [Chloroflexi bacterium GWC2_70_10]|nr:MAG: hypothetical protein A2082_06850 [Chloroflexi bacterium GWC2_70_10]
MAPALFTSLIVGTQYAGAPALIRLYGVAALSNALLSLWIAYFVGRGWMRVGAVIAAGVTAELVLLLAVARDAAAMVQVVLWVSLATHAATVALYAIARWRRVPAGSVRGPAS